MDKVENRFDLVLLATKRARQLGNGVDPLLEWEKDKPTVMALREIAAGLVTAETVAEPIEVEESIDEELAAALAGELSIADFPPEED